MNTSTLFSQQSRHCHLFIKTQSKRSACNHYQHYTHHWFSSHASSSSSSSGSMKGTSGPSSSSSSSSSSPLGFVRNIVNRYSISSQQHRIRLANHLFRAAQYQALNPQWYGKHKVQPDFGPQHAMLSMHVWFLHRRLIAPHANANTNANSSSATSTGQQQDHHQQQDGGKHAFNLMVQEELFDFFWNDTRSRIRSAGVHELTVNKHLKDAQQATFLQCTQYDHAFAEFRNEPKQRFELVCDAVWRHVLGGSQDVNDDLIRRMGAYVEYQLDNIVYKLPDDYFDEGRIAWGNIPDFSALEDGNGEGGGGGGGEEDAVNSSDTKDTLQQQQEQDQEQQSLKTTNAASGLEFLQNYWVQVLTDAGEPYYWNMETNQT
eukprot:CAMPEP_0176485404 /NCGR_PEP_ID=MMETSP0200_2-20121128/5020_1 /TAXON_ID=947934 /ORGANISM="Chaetoceros sp., Strain GSL56" /LENGTH=373 /DNA_ID=CAMNT_0017882043 /DNA_START=42 /DNA_END=1159 /DNA_ORIENTATION=-